MNHHFHGIFAYLILALSLSPARGGEWSKESDPDPEHVHILIKALQELQSYKDDHYHAQYIEEEHRSIYYKSINFLGRSATAKGPMHFFLIERVISQPLPERKEMPLAKACMYLAWFDKDMKLLGIRPDVDGTADVGAPGRIRINKDYRVFDLTDLKDLEKVTEVGKIVPEEDIIEEMHRETEQAGTGQPATRPESKSEGSDKPQPEAEGRSR